MYAPAQEEMKQVADDLFVTIDGRVFVQTSDGMRPKDAHLRDGYPTVSIKKDGKYTSRFVHQLVMQAFGPPRPSPKHIIRHKDGDAFNTHVLNLRWGTHGENKEDDRGHGRTNTFRRAGKARSAQVYLSENELREVIAAANRQHLSVSMFIRFCVMNQLQQKEIAT